MNMKRFMNKKVAAIGLAAGLTLGAAGAAFAYFTSSGTGGGSAQVGTATNDIVVTGTETTPVFPGGATGTVTFTVANSGANPEHLTNIHFVSASASGCSEALGDFSMADVPVGTDGTIAAGATAQTITETGTLVMGDTGLDQSACEGKTLTLSFTTT
jgi:hypothetical protein